MAYIEFSVEHQIIHRTDCFRVVKRSQNYLHAKFNFVGSEWNGLVKTAEFKNGKNGTPYSVLLENDECLVPHEVLSGNDKYVYVSVFAGNLITVNVCSVFLETSGYWENAVPAVDPTPSVYAQIINRLENVETSVADSARSASTSATNAHSSEVNASVSESNALQSEQNAATSEQNAQQYANSAQASATSAQSSASSAGTSAQSASSSASSALSSAQRAESASSSIQNMNVTAHSVEGDPTASWSNGTLSLGLPKGEDGYTPQKGVDYFDGGKGNPGNDGYSPIASVSKSGNTATITITDKNGTTTASVSDGSKGNPGQDGVSPSVVVNNITGGHQVIITDKIGNHSFNVLDGEDGHTPTKGTDYWTAADKSEMVEDVLNSAEISAIESSISNIETATSSDVGKGLSPKTVSNGKVTEWEFKTFGGGSGGTSDYTDLDNKPQINSVTLTGNKSLSDLGIAAEDDVSNLSTAISEVEDEIAITVTSKNMLDPSAVTIGRLSDSGTIQTNMTGYGTSDYILLKSGETYTLAREKLSAPGTAMIIGYGGYGFYDTEKVWIANSRVYDNYSDTSNPPIFTITPSNDCYIRVTCNKNYYETDTTGLIILQKGSALDGYEEYFDPYKVMSVVKKDDIVQTSGQNTDKVMSQKAVTDLVDAIEPELPEKLEDISDAFELVVGKNKYNKTACNPQDSTLYDGTTGVAKAGNNYAVTGKIPVKPNSAYNFSATDFSTVYARVSFFSGETGETYISRTDMGVVAFTTPVNCTFVGVNLFGRSHTTEEFNAAIASAQLEEGITPTQYEAYSETYKLKQTNIEGGSGLEAIGEVIDAQSPINLYDKSLAVDGKYYNSTSNVILSSENYAFSGMIPVRPGMQYSISRDPSTPLKLNGVVYTFDASGSRLSNASLSNYVYNYLLSFATGSDVRFIAFNMNLDSHTTQDFEDTIDSLMLCYGTQRPATYAAYNKETVVTREKLSDSYFHIDRFKGKKWLATGTSITWYDGKTYQAGVNTYEICRGYIGYVTRHKKLLVTNEGISGSTLALTSSDSALINRYQSLDWANTDIATLEYGVNDYGHAVDIGTENDAPGTTTFAACLKTVIEYALAQNPKICLVICTEPDVRGSTANSGGHYLYEYTDVTLAIAKQYRLPVCDWFYHSGINSLTKGNSSVDYLSADGTHPNDDGHKRMGAMLNQVFDSLIC